MDHSPYYNIPGKYIGKSNYPMRGYDPLLEHEGIEETYNPIEDFIPTNAFRKILGGMVVGAISKTPKYYYRGENTSGLKIPQIFKNAFNKIFVATKPESAKMYGDIIRKYEAPIGSNIITEGTGEFSQTMGRRSNVPLLNQLRKGETYIDAINDSIGKADRLGYDVIEFMDDSGIGSVILNNKKVKIIE